MKNSISLILPCRNEANNLPDVVQSIPDCVDEIIIVSNKSLDNTVEAGRQLAAKDARIKIIEDNRTLGGIGYGFALMSGFKAATGDILTCGDGDGNCPFQQIGEIADFLLANNYDFISCNRYPLQGGTKIPFKLRLGVALLNWEIRLLYAIPIKDALSGMWVFKKSIVEELHLTAGDWNLSPQIKINAATNPHINFTEYSIAQSQRLGGKSKQEYFKTGFSHAWWILKNRFIKQEK